MGPLTQSALIGFCSVSSYYPSLSPHPSFSLQSPHSSSPIFNLSPLLWCLPEILVWPSLFCSRWSSASHLCCLCGAVICLRAGFVGLPVWGQAWWAPMMEIVLSAAASPRLSQERRCSWTEGAMFTARVPPKNVSVKWENQSSFSVGFILICE